MRFRLSCYFGLILTLNIGLQKVNCDMPAYR